MASVAPELAQLFLKTRINIYIYTHAEMSISADESNTIFFFNLSAYLHVEVLQHFSRCEVIEELLQ